MANKRMFSRDVIETDQFMDMPLSSQALYFHLALQADDDGFVGNPRRIQRMINAADDDLKILYSKGMIIPFESGVIVIVHFLINNNKIPSDRYTETIYTTERDRLKIVKRGRGMEYRLNTIPLTVCQHDVNAE